MGRATRVLLNISECSFICCVCLRLAELLSVSVLSAGNERPEQQREHKWEKKRKIWQFGRCLSVCLCACISASEVSQRLVMIRAERINILPLCRRVSVWEYEWAPEMSYSPILSDWVSTRALERKVELEKSTAWSTAGIFHIRSKMTNSWTCPIADHCVGETGLVTSYEDTKDLQTVTLAVNSHSFPLLNSRDILGLPICRKRRSSRSHLLQSHTDIKKKLE